MDLAAIPSPTVNAFPIAGLPIRFYALCIIVGIIVAMWVGSRRWRQRGGQAGTVADIATWGIPFGLVGARLYHVITDYQLYFGPGRNPWDAFAVWNGGLGIWGAIAGGALGGWIACRRRGIPFPAFLDAAAPGIVLAQACGRWGNWFNNELYGRPTDLPWALTVYKMNPVTYHAVMQGGEPVVLGHFHPTFLYESLWCVGVALLVIWADRRFRLGHGRAFALYVAAYTAGRFWIEYLRIDPAHHILGLRLNDWTSIVVFAAAVAYIIWQRGKPREEIVEPAAVASNDAGKSKPIPGRARRTDESSAARESDDREAAEAAPPGAASPDDADDTDAEEPSEPDTHEPKPK